MSDATRKTEAGWTGAAVLLALAVAAWAGACGKDEGKPKSASRPPVAAPPAPPPEPPVEVGPPATREERAAYWLDRLVGGPEPSPAGFDWIPNYHQAVLTDAVMGLVALPPEAAALLSDEERRSRLTTQADTNPWHAILDVLGHIGPGAPGVARAWAAPAASHRELGLRRRALAVYARLADPKDAPVLLEALRRDGGDPVVAPAALRTLLSYGGDPARAAARAVYEHGSAELWLVFPRAVDEAWGEGSEDLLRWWAALAGASGPRAHGVVLPDGTRREASDPAAGPVVGPEHLFGDGAPSAAFAEAIVARRAGAAAGETHDPAAARAGLARAVDRARSEATSDAVRALVDAILGLAPGPDEEALPPLEAVVRRLRPVEAFRPAIEAAFDAFSSRGGDVGRLLEALLSGGDEDPRLAVFLVRRERDPARIPLLSSALAATPPSRMRHELRAALVWLHVAALEKGGIDPERLAAFAREVAEWVAEGAEGAGFAPSLLDLGPPGEAAYETGLRGKHRDAYLRGLAGGSPRTVPPSLVLAVIAPVTAETPEAERRLALVAAFQAADSAAEPALIALANRLTGAARQEALLVARPVRHRARR